MRCVHGNPQPQRGGMKQHDEVIARFGALMADVSEWAHRDARRLRGVKGLSVKAGRRARADQVAQSILRALEQLEALDLREILFLMGADVTIERQHEAPSLRMLPVVALDERPQVVGERNTLHCDSPDVRSA